MLKSTRPTPSPGLFRQMAPIISHQSSESKMGVPELHHGLMMPWCRHRGCTLSLSGRIQRWRKVCTTTSSVSACSPRWLINVSRECMPMASTMEGWTYHARDAMSLGHSCEKE